MATVSIRYIVYDIDAAIGFYTRHLGFSVQIHPNDMFAMLTRGDLRLVLSVPGGGPGGGQATPDGTLPQPGGWNRFSIEVPDLAAAVDRLRRDGVRFRNDLVTGVGGRQIIAEDPSGNPVELFEPVLPEARLAEARPAPAEPPKWLAKEMKRGLPLFRLCGGSGWARGRSARWGGFAVDEDSTVIRDTEHGEHDHG